MAAKCKEARKPVSVHIRWMVMCDLPEVLQIELDSFQFPWLKEDFLRCLRQRNCIGMVAEHGEKVVGFFVYELLKHELHLFSLAVNPLCRRRGIGAQMVAKLISKRAYGKRTAIITEVRETNLPAQLFFRAQGVRGLRVLRNFYPETGEDAYLMEYRLPVAMTGSEPDIADELQRRVTQSEEE